MPWRLVLAGVASVDDDRPADEISDDGADPGERRAVEFECEWNQQGGVEQNFAEEIRLADLRPPAGDDEAMVLQCRQRDEIWNEEILNFLNFQLLSQLTFKLRISWMKSVLVLQAVAAPLDDQPEDESDGDSGEDVTVDVELFHEQEARQERQQERESREAQ